MENMKESQNQVEDLNSTSEVENQQQAKTYSEEEVANMKEQLKEEYEKNFDEKFNKRWGRNQRNLEKANADKDELINLYMQQTGAKNIDELMDISYKQYKIERPNKLNSKDEEILGINDAKEILELDDESIEEEVSRLSSKKRNIREEATYSEINNYLTEKKSDAKRKKEIKESGLEENILEDQDFNEFMNKFNKDTAIKEIYEIYSNSHKSEKKKPPFSAGSLKGTKVNEEKEFYTLEEFQALTKEDLKDPKVYKKAMESRLHF